MADELTVTASVKFTKGNVDMTMVQTAFTPDVAGTLYVRGVQNVGTSEEALDMGNVTSPGWAYFRNLDASNFVEIRPATGETDLVRLLAGESCCFRFIATAPFVLADTGNVDLEYLIVEV